MDESNGNKNLLNDLDKLPKQTMNTNAEGNKGETRSINIPATKNYMLSYHPGALDNWTSIKILNSRAGHWERHKNWIDETSVPVENISPMLDKQPLISVVL